MINRSLPTLNELRNACSRRGWWLAPVGAKTWRIVQEGRDIRVGSLVEIAEFLADPIGVSRTR